eukprot:373680-Hanusia_phi.AAC.8
MVRFIKRGSRLIQVHTEVCSASTENDAMVEAMVKEGSRRGCRGGFEAAEENKGQAPQPRMFLHSRTHTYAIADDGRPDGRNPNSVSLSAIIAGTDYAGPGGASGPRRMMRGRLIRQR